MLGLSHLPKPSLFLGDCTLNPLFLSVLCCDLGVRSWPQWFHRGFHEPQESQLGSCGSPQDRCSSLRRIEEAQNVIPASPSPELLAGGWSPCLQPLWELELAGETCTSAPAFQPGLCISALIRFGVLSAFLQVRSA